MLCRLKVALEIPRLRLGMTRGFWASQAVIPSGARNLRLRFLAFGSE
jgi:hypothetical protein